MAERETSDRFQAAYEAVMNYGGYVDADIILSTDPDTPALDLEALQGISLEARLDERRYMPEDQQATTESHYPLLIYSEYFKEEAPDKACGIYAKYLITEGDQRAGVVYRTFRRPNEDGGDYNYARDTTGKGYEVAWSLIESALGKMMLLPTLTPSDR